MRELTEFVTPEEFEEYLKQVLFRLDATVIPQDPSKVLKNYLVVEVVPEAQFDKVVKEARTLCHLREKPVFFFFNDRPTVVTEDRVIGGIY